MLLLVALVQNKYAKARTEHVKFIVFRIVARAHKVYVCLLHKAHIFYHPIARIGLALVWRPIVVVYALY